MLQGCVKAGGSCTSNGGPDQDSPGRSSGQSLHCSKLGKAYANALRWAETFEVGDEVVLELRHLCVNEHLPMKLRR